MKNIVLIHTVKNMYLTFEQRLRDALGDTEVKIYNFLDDFFAENSNELGYFSNANIDRLYLILKSAELSGADLIAVICSTLSPYARAMSHLFPIPIITIDSRLGESAVNTGSDFMILASAPSAVLPTSNLIQEAAELAGKEINIRSKSDIKALRAMMSDDIPTHNQLILDMAANVSDVDTIVLAQGSMEHLTDKIAEISNLPVLSAPSLCIEEIRESIQGSSCSISEEIE